MYLGQYVITYCKIWLFSQLSSVTIPFFPSWLPPAALGISALTWTGCSVCLVNLTLELLFCCFLCWFCFLGPTSFLVYFPFSVQPLVASSGWVHEKYLPFFSITCLKMSLSALILDSMAGYRILNKKSVSLERLALSCSSI